MISYRAFAGVLVVHAVRMVFLAIAVLESPRTTSVSGGAIWVSWFIYVNRFLLFAVYEFSTIGCLLFGWPFLQPWVIVAACFFFASSIGSTFACVRHKPLGSSVVEISSWELPLQSRCSYSSRADCADSEKTRRSDLGRCKRQTETNYWRQRATRMPRRVKRDCTTFL